MEGLQRKIRTFGPRWNMMCKKMVDAVLSCNPYRRMDNKDTIGLKMDDVSSDNPEEQQFDDAWIRLTCRKRLMTSGAKFVGKQVYSV